MEASVKIVIARGETEFKLIVNLCQSVLDGREMHGEWTCVILPIL